MAPAATVAFSVGEVRSLAEQAVILIVRLLRLIGLLPTEAQLDAIEAYMEELAEAERA